MDNTLTWLHLSDLHCCPRTDWDARHVLTALRDDLAQLADEHELRPDLIFFTGDAAFGELPGHPLADQFDEAARFFEKLREHSGVERENVFLVPGNHDVDRSAITDDDTVWLDERRKAYDRPAVDEMLRQGHGDERWRRIMTRLDVYRAFLERAGYAHLVGDPERLIYAQSRDVSSASSTSTCTATSISSGSGRWPARATSASPPAPATTAPTGTTATTWCASTSRTRKSRSGCAPTRPPRAPRREIAGKTDVHGIWHLDGGRCFPSAQLLRRPILPWCPKERISKIRKRCWRTSLDVKIPSLNGSILALPFYY